MIRELKKPSDSAVFLLQGQKHMVVEIACAEPAISHQIKLSITCGGAEVSKGRSGRYMFALGTQAAAWTFTLARHDGQPFSYMIPVGLRVYPAGAADEIVSLSNLALAGVTSIDAATFTFEGVRGTLTRTAGQMTATAAPTTAALPLQAPPDAGTTAPPPAPAPGVGARYGIGALAEAWVNQHRRAADPVPTSGWHVRIDQSASAVAHTDTFDLITRCVTPLGVTAVEPAQAVRESSDQWVGAASEDPSLGVKQILITDCPPAPNGLHGLAIVICADAYGRTWASPGKIFTLTEGQIAALRQADCGESATDPVTERFVDDLGKAMLALEEGTDRG